MSLVNFMQGECELTSGDASDVPTEAMIASLVTCCNNNADELDNYGTDECCSRGLSHGGFNEKMLKKCGAGGGSLCPPGQNYPSIHSKDLGGRSFKCCMGQDPQDCTGDEDGTALCGLYWEVARTNSCMSDPVRGNMGQMICPGDVPGGFWQNGQNALPSCTTPTPPTPPRKKCAIKHCISCTKDGKYCHMCKKGTKLDWQGKKCCTRAEIAAGTCQLKKPLPRPKPSPGVGGKGPSSGGMSGGEIAGIVIGSVAGAILLILLVGVLLRGSGKKGKKK